MRSIRIHEEFDPETLQNNIAILKLDRAARLKEGVIDTLYILPDDINDITGRTGILSGWGNGGKLKRATGTVMTNYSCGVRYQGLTDKQVCAANNEQAPCIGDEGAPLVWYDPAGIPVQIGIFSFIKNGDCTYKWPAVYTHVGAYAEWITKNL